MSWALTAAVVVGLAFAFGAFVAGLCSYADGPERRTPLGWVCVYWALLVCATPCVAVLVLLVRAVHAGFGGGR